MQKKIKILLFLLLILSGILTFLPFLDYQVHLAQGDHGRDLYAAEAVWRGELPYKDFWWVYGPIMPYLYGIFYKLFGVSVGSMLLGQVFFKILAGILIYLGLSRWIVPWGAALCALWFWSLYPDFFYTYNHTGGITLLMAVTCCLLYYLKEQKAQYLYLGLLALFFLAFVKVNIALFSLAAFMILVTIIHLCLKVPFASAKSFYGRAVLLMPCCIFLIYFLFLKDLSIYEIRQCLPYLSEDHPYNAPPMIALRNIVTITLNNISSSLTSILLALLVLLSCAKNALWFFNKKTPLSEKRDFGLIILVLVVFYIANFHEFWASGFVLYRSLWSKPFSIVLMFFVIYFALQSLPRWINIALSLIFTAILIMNNYGQNAVINNIKQSPWQNLDIDRAHVTLSNEAAWIQTVRQATQYLKETVPLNETFLSLPYDPLYYFLAGKQAPTRQLIFFEHINIPPQQELSIIQELEKNKVTFILKSNRSLVPGDGLGIFGKTYCPEIGKYIDENFEVIRSFGLWQPPRGDGWAWDHSVQILKRVSLKPN